MLYKCHSRSLVVLSTVHFILRFIHTVFLPVIDKAIDADSFICNVGNLFSLCGVPVTESYPVCLSHHIL